MRACTGLGPYLVSALVLAAAAVFDQERPGPDAAGGAVPSFAPAEYRFEEVPAWHLLEELVALGPRYDEEPRRRGFERARADVAGWGATRVSEQEFRLADGTPGWNCFAEYDGQGPLAGERIAIMGHHDTVPRAPGALDNGTAVALLAGLGRALAGRRLPRTVVLAVVDLEERGLCGTRAWVAREAEAGTLARYRAAISTEMLGWKDGIPVLHTFPTAFHSRPPGERPPGGGLAPRWLAALALAVGRDTGRPLHFGDRLLFPVEHLIFRHFVTPFESDSGAFAERGVPALFLSDCSFSRFYPDYHRPTDTLDKVDRASFAAAGRSLEALTLALAGRPRLPRADGGAREAEIDYLTIGAWVLPAWCLRLALLCAAAPFLAGARRRTLAGERPGTGAWRVGWLLVAATGVAAVAAPVAAFVVLFPAWLVAPLVLRGGRAARILGAAGVLAPALSVVAVCLFAMHTFRRTVAPTHAGWALGLIVAIALGLAAVALFPRRASAQP